MERISKLAVKIFSQCIADYHLADDINGLSKSNFEPGTIERQLYDKCWIDTVQWHLEDLIRDRMIEPADALDLKRRIDALNQERTSKVEELDEFIISAIGTVNPLPGAKINTESLAWAIDRLSILCLKIYHMGIEAVRKDAGDEHRVQSAVKLNHLQIQQDDLMLAIDQLMEDIRSGERVVKNYKQHKMYNDPEYNPVLYKKPL